MKVLRTKTENDLGYYSYYLINDDKKLGIIFCDNGDLYFTPFEQGSEIEFDITKENIIIYNLFADLLKSFKETIVFQVTEFNLTQCNSLEEQKKLYTKIQEENQKLKNTEIYKKVFSNDKIIWISDDSISFDYKNANAMIISNEGEYFKLKFTYYERDLPYIRSIRIRTARSRYKPFNLLMMDFFNNLQNYNPDFHQIDIEEYLYIQTQQRKLIK